MLAALTSAKFLTSKPFLMGLGGLVVVVTLLIGYHHYTGLLDKVTALEAQQAQLQTALDIERATVRDLQGLVSDWAESQTKLLGRVREMQEVASDAAAESRRLRKFYSQLDFDSLSHAAADSLADGTTGRLWGLLEDATDSGRYPGGGTAPGAPPAAGTEPGRAGSSGLDGGGS